MKAASRNDAVLFKVLAYTAGVLVQQLEITDIADLDALFGRGAECTPLGMQPFSASARVLRSPTLFIGEVRSRSPYQVRRQVGAGRVCIAYAHAPSEFSVRPRKSLSFADIAVAGEGALELRMRRPSHVVWIEADTSAFPQLRTLAAPCGEVRVVRPAEPFCTALRGFVSATLAMCAADPGLFEDYALRARIEQDLVMRMTRALKKSTASPPPSKRERKMDELARRIVSSMWQNVEEPVRLSQLCRSAGCGTRSAIYYFKELFGLGPITYLKILRLTAAHRRMRDPACRLRIIDVAADFGFWHMGHFGSDYRRTFGRTASQTLARARSA